MPSHLARLGWLWFPAATLAACGGSGFDTLDGVGSHIAEDDWIDAVVDIQCQQQMDCDCYVLAAPDGEDPYSYQLEQCKSARRSELEHHVEQMHALGMRYDGGCAATKLAEAQGWGCDDAMHIAAARGSYRTFADSCRVYYGDVNEGDSCEVGPYDNCGSGLWCSYQDYDEVTYEPIYICESTLGGREGAACTNDRNCRGDLFCNGEVCARYPTVGEPCGYGSCAPGARCDYDANGGVCRALGADGASCTLSNVGCLGDCVDGVCAMASAAICDFDARRP